MLFPVNSFDDMGYCFLAGLNKFFNLDLSSHVYGLLCMYVMKCSLPLNPFDFRFLMLSDSVL